MKGDTCVLLGVKGLTSLGSSVRNGFKILRVSPLVCELDATLALHMIAGTQWSFESKMINIY